MGHDLRNTYWSAVIKSVHSRKCNPSNASPRQCSLSLMASLSGVETSLALFMLTREAWVMQTQLCPKPPSANGFQVHYFMSTKNKEMWTQKNKENTDSLRKIENEFTRLGQAPKEKHRLAALIVCVALVFHGFYRENSVEPDRLSRDWSFCVHNGPG